MNIHLRSAIAVLAMMVIANAASAQTKFFEKNYVRGKGAPERIVETFTIQNPDGEFSVLVQNGEGKRGKVSSAVINLNGQLIVGPNAFNKQVDSLTKPVTLKKENELTVEVRSQPGTSVSISILGPDLPTPSPVSGVTVVPNAFPTDSPTQVTFTSAISYSPTGPTPSVQLERVTNEGEFISLEGSMVDNGQLSLGDEIFGDGVFSFRKTFSMSEPSKVYLRVKTDINGSVSYSEIFSLTAFTPLLDTDAATVEEVLTSGRKLYYELLPEKGHDQAAAEAVSLIKAYSLVQDAGIVESGNTIWVEFTNGVSGVVPLGAPGTKGGGLSSSLSVAASSSATTAPSGTSNIAVDSKRVLILAPFYDEFKGDDDGPAVKSLYESHNQATPCPLYDIVYLENSQVGVESFKALGEYGIVHISSHGDVTNNGDVIVGTKTPWAANQKKYQADIATKRLVSMPTATGVWMAATPEFFRYYIKSMPSSLVYFSSCESTANNTMSSVLQAKGAKTFLGFSKTVFANFALKKSTYFHKEWIDDPSALVTTGEVFNGGCDSGGACWNMIGANNLQAALEELQNGGFESGNLGAWDANGDGRVLTQLGQFGPTEKSYLGVISTGLGYTTSSGSIKQSTCLAPDAKTLDFSWNFNSEEFIEWCGSQYQDTFNVNVITSTGKQTVFSRKVDDLCGMVMPSSLKFDQSSGSCDPNYYNDCKVWTTGWQSQSIDISGIASTTQGKPVTLEFSAGDVGDSVFDTAILLDDIKVTRK